MRVILAILLLVVTAAHAEVTAPRQHVLILHSYNKGLSWTDSINDGIERALRAAVDSGTPLQIDYEYMDTKRYTDPEYYNMLYGIYKHKYSGKHYDVIISSDDNALDFLFLHRDEIFGHVPVVFCGVNYWSDDRLKGKDNYTGVVEAFDLRANIELARDLFPKTREIVFVGDRTSSGIANHKIAEQVIPEFRSLGLEFRFLEDGTLQEYQRDISALKPGSVVIALLTNQDRSGATFTYEDGFDVYAKGAQVPILSPWDFYLRRGALGGMMISGPQQGREAARMALRVLSGDPVASIPVLTRSPNRYFFDHQQMARFGIQPEQLPPGAEIINEKSLLEAFYERYRFYIWTGAGFILALLAAIVLLLVNIGRRVRAERAQTALVTTLSETNRAYSRFVPQEFLRFLGHASILDVKLADQVHKEITIVFTDIRSFTTLCEDLTPEQIFRLINEYLSAMAPIVRQNGGLIDKYIGDAIMALFPRGPADAVRAAVQMQIRLQEFNRSRQQAASRFFEHVPALEMGVGIHTGGLMVGIIGEAERMEGTALSDSVNLGSRLEGLCKLFDARIAISGYALEMCLGETGDAAFNYRFLGRLRVKGKREPIGVFEVIDADPEALRTLKLRTLDDYNAAIHFYFERNFEQAANRFAMILELNDRDGAARFYLEHCRRLQNATLPGDWNGIIQLDAK